MLDTLDVKRTSRLMNWHNDVDDVRDHQRSAVDRPWCWPAGLEDDEERSSQSAARR